MNRRNYIQSVASLTALSLLPTTEEEENQEYPYNIYAMFHRGKGEGYVETSEYSYTYNNQREWQASAVVSSSIQGIDLVHRLTAIDNIELVSVSDLKQGHTRILLTASNSDFDLDLSTRRMREMVIYHTDSTEEHILFEGMDDLKQKIKERV